MLCKLKVWFLWWRWRNVVGNQLAKLAPPQEPLPSHAYMGLGEWGRLIEKRFVHNKEQLAWDRIMLGVFKNWSTSSKTSTGAGTWIFFFLVSFYSLFAVRVSCSCISCRPFFFNVLPFISQKKGHKLENLKLEPKFSNKCLITNYWPFKGIFLWFSPHYFENAQITLF